MQITCASTSGIEISLDKNSSRNLELKLSTFPFFYGALGSMYGVLVSLFLRVDCFRKLQDSADLIFRFIRAGFLSLSSLC